MTMSCTVEFVGGPYCGREESISLQWSDSTISFAAGGGIHVYRIESREHTADAPPRVIAVYKGYYPKV